MTHCSSHSGHLKQLESMTSNVAATTTATADSHCWVPACCAVWSAIRPRPSNLGKPACLTLTLTQCRECSLPSTAACSGRLPGTASAIIDTVALSQRNGFTETVAGGLQGSSTVASARLLESGHSCWQLVLTVGGMLLTGTSGSVQCFGATPMLPMCTQVGGHNKLASD
jgi:hypothetical protein